MTIDRLADLLEAEGYAVLSLASRLRGQERLPHTSCQDVRGPGERLLELGATALRMGSRDDLHCMCPECRKWWQEVGRWMAERDARRKEKVTP